MNCETVGLGDGDEDTVRDTDVERHSEGFEETVLSPALMLPVGRCVPAIDSNGVGDDRGADAETVADLGAVATVGETDTEVDGDAGAEGLHTAPVNTTYPETPTVDAVPAPTKAVDEFVTNPGNAALM